MSRAPVYVGILTSAELADGTEFDTPPVFLCHVAGLGLVTAERPDDIARGLWLDLAGRPGQRVRALTYYRSPKATSPTRDGGIPYWRHEVSATVIDPQTGAIQSPSATICPIAGDYVCGG